MRIQRRSGGKRARPDATVIDLRDRIGPVRTVGVADPPPAGVAHLFPGPRIERSETAAEEYVRSSGVHLRSRDLPTHRPWTWVELAEALDRGCCPRDYAELRSLRPAVRPSAWLRVRVALWVVVLCGASLLMFTLPAPELRSVAVLVGLAAVTLLFSDVPASSMPVARETSLGHHEVMWALADIDLTEARRHRDVFGLPAGLSWRLAGLPERFAPASYTR